MNEATIQAMAPLELEQCYRTARELLRHHGKSYYFATRLFPPQLQRATSALYAFVRLPDEIVDNSPQSTPEEIETIKQKLLQWLDDWRAAYAAGASSHPILHVAAITFHQYSIPYKHSEDFIHAMIQDTDKATYSDYDDLKQYMYGSAAVVGLMMSHIIGYSDVKALQHAEQLGYAMQLTNFLRDIDEDYQLRRRVYMPQDELARFGLSTDDIAARRFSSQFQEFTRFQVQRARSLYRESDRGIPLLNREGRFAVTSASRLYEAILTKIEKQQYNPFAGRASTNKAEKVLLAARAWKASRGNFGYK